MNKIPGGFQAQPARGPRAWMTKAEMAKYLNCTPRHINTLMRRRVLPFVKSRGLVRFDRDDCDRALDVFRSRSLVEARRKDSEPQPAPLACLPPLPPVTPAGGAEATPNEDTPGAGRVIQARTFDSVNEARSFLLRIEAETGSGRTGGFEGFSNARPITIVVLQPSESAPALPV